MSLSRTYGGWADSNQTVARAPTSIYAGYQQESIDYASTTTNVSSSFVRWLGYLATAGAALTCTGTGSELLIEKLQCSTDQMQHIAPIVQIADVAPIRTPAEDLARIREVLKPAVSDLATTFGVSRQSIYNWLNGEPVADENAAKLQDLAQAADVLAHGGVAMSPAVLKRKFANGRTLMQVAQAGESARNAAQQLVHIHKRETAQRERMVSRFANSAKTAPSADFDLPLSNDHA